MRNHRWISSMLLCTACLCAVAADIEENELRVKRQNVFEFTQPPKVTRKDEKAFEISFASKAACDATVAIEGQSGEILRHLASGVLGPNAPEPFQKDSLRQTLVWDGKDDEGEYVLDLGSTRVRVSLGLKPTFEKSLFEDPRKRYSRLQQALICPAKEGVYVYDGGNSIDFIRLYDHEGNYVRTIYPFPANKIEKVNGLNWREYPEDGLRLPLKVNFLQNSLLTGGTQAFGLTTFVPQENKFNSVGTTGYAHYGMEGWNANAMAQAGGRIATAGVLLNRLGTDGTSGGMNLTGTRTSIAVKNEGPFERGKDMEVSPRSAALSPDGKTLYLTGYLYSQKTAAMGGIVHHSKWCCFHGVFKLNIIDDKPMELFAGSKKPDEAGSDNARFNLPISVATDAEGNVYIADYLNDRVQVYSSSAAFLRTIKAPRPAQVSIDPVKGELIVMSFLVHNDVLTKSGAKVPATLTRMGPLKNPAKIASYELPTLTYSDKVDYHYYGSGVPMMAAYDPYAPKPRVWLSEEIPAFNAATKGNLRHQNVRIVELDEKKPVVKRDFDEEVAKTIIKKEPAFNSRQRITVNPKTGKLYVCEGQTPDNIFGSYYQTIQIDPETGKAEIIDLPFDAEDMCFDNNGLAYMRSYSAVARYALEGGKWREVPFDYGDEYIGRFITTTGHPKAEAQSALTLPANGSWHSGGMFVSLKGNLLLCCNYVMPGFAKGEITTNSGGKPYQPPLYPGRNVAGRGGGVFLHIWDKYGKLACEDAVSGLADNTYGLGLDQQNNVYALVAATRMYKGQKFFNDMTGTLIKFKPGASKIVSDAESAPIPLPKNEVPQRAPDLSNSGQGNAWIESGAAWCYGGVGWCGKNRGIGCACFNCHFAFDYFNRSFAPEIQRYSVAVVDSSGNLIVRIGRYGNPDSAGAGSAVPIGGDEVALLNGSFTAVHTDKRLFIADPSNGRIVSVKLNYHASETVPLGGLASSK